MAEVKKIEGLEDDELALTMGDMRREKLLSWVMGKVQDFEKARDSDGTEEMMSRFYHIWRGKYHEGLKNRKSEVSKLIHPATSAAIDGYIGELESATIDNDYFTAIQDNDTDEDIAVIEKQLRVDLKDPKAGIYDSLSMIGLMSAIFGEAAAEVYTYRKPQLKIVQGPDGEPRVSRGNDKLLLRLDPTLPTQFIYDVGAASIEDSLGLGSRKYVPMHTVIEKQSQGVWRSDVKVVPSQVSNEMLLDSDLGPQADAEVVEIIKWNGKVPRALIEKESDDEPVIVDADNPEIQRQVEVDEEDLIEAMVVIMNEGEILMDRPNPTLLQDRMFIYHRMERVPGTLRGRGLAEKAHSAQSALDANLRAQMEATAKVVHPVFGVNKLMAGSRGFRFKQRPGQVNEFNGDPRAAVARLDLGDVSPSLFTNTDKLEQLVAQATSTFDQSANNQTASISQNGGANLAVSSFLKKAKKGIRNFNEDVIIPFVNMAARIFMQLDPEHYKPTDVTFTAIGTMGALAREIEQAHALNLMKTVPVESPAWWMLFRAVMVNSNFKDKEAMVGFADVMLEQSVQPKEDPLQEAQIREIENKIENQSQDTRTNRVRALAETARVALEMANSDVEAAKMMSDAILNLAKAEGEEEGNQSSLYREAMAQLVTEAGAKINESGVFPNEEIQIARATALEGATGDSGV